MPSLIESLQNIPPNTVWNSRPTPQYSKYERKIRRNIFTYQSQISENVQLGFSQEPQPYDIEDGEPMEYLQFFHINYRRFPQRGLFIPSTSLRFVKGFLNENRNEVQFSGELNTNFFNKPRWVGNDSVNDLGEELLKKFNHSIENILKIKGLKRREKRELGNFLGIIKSDYEKDKLHIRVD